ncbi:sporadically distributed protein, TIGR04141 family [Chryseobacterium wanjuense]|uniref:Sporadically distributed protein, TIGR04141 family n=1 Tax=Chryseobacterium wanjuense TaxID=356305 RepID=A0A1I0N998_9FLAO|nr:DUF6119 family protein [Chryseobacterium wanjuense]SEV97430.1 sporadically distributed protein, TIGR04141 family [Chryseobacterium wanjuense]
MSNTVNAKLYKVQDFIVKEKDDNEAVIQEIIDSYLKRKENEFIPINLSNSVNIEGWNAKLYVFTTGIKVPSWYDFLASIVDEESELDNIKVQNSTFVLFVYDHESIFIISRGYHGHSLLDEYIEPFFGMDVLSKLVNKNSTEIRQLEERGLFGIELGAQRYFRENYSLAFEDDFGKIYKAMLASINEDDFGKLGIIKKKESTTKLSINGGSSLEISSKFDYEELINRLKKIKELLKLEGVEFNQFYRLPLSNPINKELNDCLLDYAYECLINNENIDFYNPNLMHYVRSTETEFFNKKDGNYCEKEYSASSNYIEIMKLLKDNNLIDDTSLETFKESLDKTQGHFRENDSGEFIFPSKLSYWISGEVEYGGNKYFKLDGSWYVYRDSLDHNLNEYFKDFDFESYAPIIPLESWVKKSEGSYNESFKNKEGFIIGDRAYLNYIEIADLIRVTDDKIYLYHVKKGLGQDTRVLINQINNSARFLSYSEDEESIEGIKSYYKSVSDKHYNGGKIKLKENNRLKQLSEKNFIDLFKSNRKICFVFAYGSDNVLSIKDEIIASNSRIAKLSLIYIIRDMKRTDYELLFERILLEE